MGRRPRPTALKRIEGNPGKRPLNENEPQPDGRPEKPDFLSGRSVQLWDRYWEIGYWLTSAESMLLALWCCKTAELESDPHGVTPSWIAQYRLLSAELGFSPTARARLSVKREKPEEEKPKAEKFFIRPA